MVVVLMGVSGSGKTVVGRRVTAELGWQFADADDYHPAANIQKMTNGIPLTDDDRAPWLSALRAQIADWIAKGTNGVLACSALKQVYRDELKVGPQVRFFYLHASPEVLSRRLLTRVGHFMKENMLQSQLRTLEVPADAVVIDANGTVDEAVRQMRKKVGSILAQE